MAYYVAVTNLANGAENTIPATGRQDALALKHRIAQNPDYRAAVRRTPDRWQTIGRIQTIGPR